MVILTTIIKLIGLVKTIVAEYISSHGRSSKPTFVVKMYIIYILIFKQNTIKNE